MPEGTAVAAPLAVLLRKFEATEPALVCADPAGAYANCLALSAHCAEWLRERGVDCGLIRFSSSRAPFPEGSGRWPFCDPRGIRHWTVRVGSWSIDWTARQFRPHADWPDVRRVDSLVAWWRLIDTWACPRCPELVAHPAHRELAPIRLESEHRNIARATRGRGPFRDPRHDDTPGLAVLCACERSTSRTDQPLRGSGRRRGLSPRIGNQ